MQMEQGSVLYHMIEERWENRRRWMDGERNFAIETDQTDRRDVT